MRAAHGVIACLALLAMACGPGSGPTPTTGSRPASRGVATPSAASNAAVASANARIPAPVLAVLDTIRETAHAPAGYRGGRTFSNDGRGHGQVLPRRTRIGLAIQYREWDVHPYHRGVNRGADRLITASDGRAWYTDDHYRTFIPISP
ncbi:MAG: ribonuclease domain-containing protein [Gemmatimonadaceae bacterium]